jgi:hypothetical protein
MQQTIPIFREIKEPIDLPVGRVAKQGTFQQAIKLCMDESIVRGRTNNDWADLLGCSKGYVNQVYNGGSAKSGNPMCFNLDQIHQLQVEAGNWAIYQWLDLRKKGQLESQSTEARKAQLLAELAQLEAQDA